MTDLVSQIFTVRFEPWKVPLGKRPRLKGWKKNVTRLAPKPSVMEMLEAGQQAGDPLGVTVARIRRAYPQLTEEEWNAEFEAYQTWLQTRIDRHEAPSRTSMKCATDVNRAELDRYVVRHFLKANRHDRG